MFQLSQSEKIDMDFFFAHHARFSPLLWSFSYQRQIAELEHKIAEQEVLSAAVQDKLAQIEQEVRDSPAKRWRISLFASTGCGTFPFADWLSWSFLFFSVAISQVTKATNDETALQLKANRVQKDVQHHKVRNG